MNKLPIVFLLVIVLAAGIFALTFEDCGSTVGKFVKVDVSNCDLDGPACILKRNTNATIRIDFTSTVPAENVTARVFGRIAELDMPFKLPDPRVCSQLDCPLKPEKTYEYEATLPVLKAYPKINVLVKYQLLDDQSEQIVCVTIPAKIE